MFRDPSNPSARRALLPKIARDEAEAAAPWLAPRSRPTTLYRAILGATRRGAAFFARDFVARLAVVRATVSGFASRPAQKILTPRARGRVRRVPQAVTVLFLSALAASAWAETPINENRPLNPDAKVQVSNCAGTILVKAWDKNSLSLTGTLGEGAEKLLIEGDARKLRIEVKLPRNTHNVQETELYLMVPAGVSLDLEGVSSDILVQGTKGALTATSVSGDVRLVVDSSVISAQTVSGDLHLEAVSRETQVKSVSGDVFVEGPQGSLVGETVSGNLVINGKLFSKLWLKSVSGDFDVDASLTDSAKANLETLSGQVLLDLPSSTNAAIDLNTFSGEIASELGGPLKEGVHKASLKVGSGGGRVSIHSFSGDIELRKK
jgi:DUF4097 and DUF4098 domain-containing protein YvlB